MTIVNLLNLSTDAVCLLFYILWESADMGWISWDATIVYGYYSISWEVSTLCEVYLMFIFSPTYRELFCKFYKSAVFNCWKKFHR